MREIMLNNFNRKKDKIPLRLAIIEYFNISQKP